MDNVRKEFEETALLGCKAVRDFLTYQGTSKSFMHRARAGAVAMGSYARLRATMANETALRLAAEKRAIVFDGSADKLIGLMDEVNAIGNGLINRPNREE